MSLSVSVKLMDILYTKQIAQKQVIPTKQLVLN